LGKRKIPVWDEEKKIGKFEFLLYLASAIYHRAATQGDFNAIIQGGK
tara:strand:- start:14 stop:154 length:141 start_codon:yes stop_codon:yes gene_type:complete